MLLWLTLQLEGVEFGTILSSFVRVLVIFPLPDGFRLSYPPLLGGIFVQSIGSGVLSLPVFFSFIVC